MFLLSIVCDSYSTSYHSYCFHSVVRLLWGSKP